MARWKELCMDTTADDEQLGRFWADALGLDFRSDDEAGYMVGSTEGHGIAMCRVPEQKTVKNRVHLDVYASSVDALAERGATVVRPAEQSGLPWTVLEDPEGGELCVFVREDVPEYRLFQLVVDASDAQAAARWWADVLGAETGMGGSPEWWRVRGVPGMPFERLTFQQVPEPKTVKNRIHWDVYGSVEAMRDKGATLLRPRDEEISWNVMADPEGNEFCVFER